MLKILVCGDQNWRDEKKINVRLAQLAGTAEASVPTEMKKISVIHGDARGADRIAGEVAKRMGMTVVAVPAEWDGPLKKAAGPVRNRKMLDMKPDLVIAFHADLKRSKGTLDCIMEANRRGIVVEIIP